MTADESKAARILLKWDQDELAKRARISRATVGRFERGEAVTNVIHYAMRRALEKAGIVFIAAGSSYETQILQSGILLRSAETKELHGKEAVKNPQPTSAIAGKAIRIKPAAQALSATQADTRKSSLRKSSLGKRQTGH